MIDARELRIGNWLKSGNEYFTVSNLEENVSYGGDIQPIELTEDILIKAGFENGVSESFFKIRVGGSELHINPENGVVWIYNPIGQAFNNPALIQYVHQLQNLYWCLSGQELDITL